MCSLCSQAEWTWTALPANFSSPAPRPGALSRASCLLLPSPLFCPLPCLWFCAAFPPALSFPLWSLPHKLTPPALFSFPTNPFALKSKVQRIYHFLFQNVRQLSSAWWKIIDEMLATSCPRSTHYSQLMQAPGHLSLHRSSGAALLAACPHTAMTFKIPRQHSPHTLFLQG